MLAQAELPVSKDPVSPEPLFSNVETSLLQQGIQKLINECDDHLVGLMKGQQGTTQDTALASLSTLYNNRKADCWKLLRRLTNMPQFANSIPGSVG